MKNKNKPIFIAATEATAVAFVSSLVMLFKKKKGWAGFFAIIGIFGMLLAIASHETDKPQEKRCALKEKIKKAVEKTNFETMKGKAVESDSPEELTQEECEKKTCSADDIDCSTDCSTRESMKKIDTAIDILKGVGAAPGDLDEVI